jgi:four helix bundle protein
MRLGDCSDGCSALRVPSSEFMNKHLKNYKDLVIYKLAHRLAVVVHGASMKLPQYEMYEEGSQVRRSSKGIAACIVEGYGRRKYKAEFVKFLIYAHASCDETIEHLNLIQETHASEGLGVAELIQSYEELGGKINRFIRYVESRWNEDVSLQP